MARQWFVPLELGAMIDEDETEEWFVPSLGQINEDQAAAGAGAANKRTALLAIGRLMS